MIYGNQGFKSQGRSTGYHLELGANDGSENIPLYRCFGIYSLLPLLISG